MKLSVIKGITFGVVFIAAAILFGVFSNRGNMDMTAQMNDATQPLIYMDVAGNTANCLYGYRDELDMAYVHDNITPLEEGRKLSFTIDKFGQNITGVSYQVRSVSGERLIEETVVEDTIDRADTMDVSITLKDLIDTDTEYMLVLLLQTEEEDEPLRYYTRIIQSDSLHQKEKIDFLMDFHDKTFDKNSAGDIAKYLESDATGDNTSLNLVNIHCSFDQITWADLEVTQETKPILSVLDLNGSTGAFELSYIASSMEGKETTYYQVVEYYSVRYTTNRMYLLDFERKMEQIFEPEESSYVNNKIVLGIGSADMQMEESDDGKTIAFVTGDRLFSYNATNSKMSTLFSFYDTKELDQRELNQEYGIKIMNVDEVGNVSFMVYGYMCRGQHEGHMGVCVYYYDNLTGIVKEQVYIPYTKSYEILKNGVEKLSYINKNGKLFLELEDSIYEIDIESKTYSVLVTDLEAGQCKVSKSGQMVVWQDNEENVYESKTIHVMDLNTEEVMDITAESDEYILALGFIGEDLIYGLAKKTDIQVDNNGYLVYPMYRVKIQNESGQILKTYDPQGIYVVDAVVEENQIKLSRVSKEVDTDTGVVTYEKAPEDQIVSAQDDSVGKNYTEFGYSDLYEYFLRIVVNGKIKASAVQNFVSEFELYEGSKEVAISIHNNAIRYYVYDTRGIIDISTEAEVAVDTAYNANGLVLNDTGTYVWRNEARRTKNQIMAIKENVITEEKNALSVCLDTILAKEGVTRNTAYMLQQGQNAIQILEENLESAQVLDLTGCDFEAMLYYLNRDIPVLVRLERGGAVLVTGFNDTQIVIMDPISGTLYKKNMDTAKEEFAKNGNCFITYVYLE